MSERGKRKTKVGIVISDKMEKTITVQVDRLVKHPKYGKYIRKYHKFKAHDEEGQAKMGDKVEIMETRPLSKTKNWRLMKVLVRKGDVV
jgi:small subunit ribosomal protein S17